MRIVLIASLLYPLLGGPEKLVFKLAEKYSELGHDVYVMTFVGGKKEFYSKFNFKVILLPFVKTKKLKYIVKHLFAPYIIKKLISIKPDVIHIHDTPFVFPSMIYKKIFHDCPVILTPHSIFDRKSLFPYRLFFGLNLKSVDNIATVGTRIREDIKKMYDVDSVLIPLFINTDEYKKVPKNEVLRIKRKYSIPLDKKIILTVGRVAQQKNLELAINSIAEVIKKDKNILYVIVGSGDQNYKNSLIELTNRLGIDGHVKMIGGVSEEEITSIYSMGDLFLTTTLWETISIAAMEALSCSIPVVSTNAGSMKDIIINGYNGFLVDKREPKEVAKKILLALKNRRSLSSNARHIIEKNFSIDVASKEYLELYKKLINENKLK